MIEPTQTNVQAAKPSDQTPAAKVSRNSSKTADAVLASDSANVSATAQSHAQYMNVLRSLPDVRPDVVAKTQEGMQSAVRYPPISIIDGLSALVGGVIAKDKFPA